MELVRNMFLHGNRYRSHIKDKITTICSNTATQYFIWKVMKIMVKCKNCKNFFRSFEDVKPFYWCEKIADSPHSEMERECSYYKSKTNAERIRSMTDDELAAFCCKVKADYQWVDHEYPDEDACGDWEKWLLEESEE